MLAIIYEHPTKKTVIKYYMAQDFGECGTVQTVLSMHRKGYEMTMRITIPNEYIKKMKGG